MEGSKYVGKKDEAVDSQSLGFWSFVITYFNTIFWPCMTGSDKSG